MNRVAEFSGPELDTVRLQGADYLVGPLTMGQRRRIMKSFAKVQAPKPVQVDVQGLVEAMLRASDDEIADSEKDKIKRAMVVQRIQKQAIPEIVLQAIREARAIGEMWPPDPTDNRGMTLINDNPQVYQDFLFIVLSQHNPGFSTDLATRMAGNLPDGPDTSLSLAEHADLIDKVLVEPARKLERQREQEQAADEGDGPKSSGSGGATSTPQDPEPAGA